LNTDNKIVTEALIKKTVIIVLIPFESINSVNPRCMLLLPNVTIDQLRPNVTI